MFLCNHGSGNSFQFKVVSVAFLFGLRRFTGAAILALLFTATALAQPRIPWTILSTTTGDLPPANGGEEQTTCVVGDIDHDGDVDFFIGERSEAPAVILYRRHATGWDRYIIEAGAFGVEAGGDVADIDGDGDLDLAMGEGLSGGDAWWWENPSPNFDPSVPWTRRLIRTGGRQQHDQRFGDFNGDGRLEFASWGNLASVVDIFAVPEDPTESPWPLIATIPYVGVAFLPEGMDVADVDLDGKVDILAGGHWIRHESGTTYTLHAIDSSYVTSRIIGGQFIPGGRPEVVLCSGDLDGPLSFYRYDGNSWSRKDLIPFVIHGHSLQAGDFDGDGHLDIFTGEMGDPGAGPNCKAWILWGDGAGNFTQEEISRGRANHMSRLADLDGDGDLDIVMKPFQFGSPQVNVFINETKLKPSLDRWEKFLIDGEMPWQPLLLLLRDIDADRKIDIVAGGWWYKNPGNINATWVRNAFGGNLKNMAWVDDFDGDGDFDIFGSNGDPVGGELSWARNNGVGVFTVFDQIAFGQNEFFQGAMGGVFTPGNPILIAMQWENGEGGSSPVEGFTVPANPGSGPWTKTVLNPTSHGEELTKGDIDGDGDLDLFQGGGWLRNEGNGVWTHFPVSTFTPPKGTPDRNQLVDIDKDGDLDAVVGLSHFTDPLTYLLWLEQPADPTQLWTQHIIVDGVWGGYSIDTADIDGDGDSDILLGEHRGETRALIYENVDGGSTWIQHTVDPGGPGIDHHNGTKLADLDGDGDLDFVSMGWDHDKLWIFKNNTAVLPDIEPPSTPTNLLATSVSSFRIDLSWARAADNRAVTGYRVFRNGVDIATTSEPSFTDTNLASQTQYAYYVVAIDAAANRSSPSSTVTATTPNRETQPPSSPGNLRATPFSTKIVLSWNAATDNRGVAGYRIYRHGVVVATTTSLSYSDSGLSKNTSYSYQVSAFDAEGNTSPPSQAGITTATRTLMPLLAGYDFDETTGSTVHDISGNGNDGVLSTSAARHATGYFGRAVEFHGGGGEVNIGTFNPEGNEFTWTIWFKADDFGVLDARLISNASSPFEEDNYFMLSTVFVDGQIRLRFRLKTTSGGTATIVASSPPLQPGIWTHAAATYNGAVMKLYQNGIEVASAPKSGAIVSGPGVETWIGANPDSSKFFDGLIDEVRCYNLALGSAEISQVMDFPLQGGTPDTEAPGVPEDVIATAVSESEVRIDWEASSDNTRIMGYRIYRDGVHVASSPTPGFVDRQLSAGRSYAYRVSAVDGWFNQSILSPSSSTTTHGFVAVEIVGEGIATMDPDLESYPLGTPVLVRAIPEATWKFTGWSGVASPLSNPISLVVTGAHHFTALFTPINNTPPTISGLADLVVSEDDRGRTIPFTIGDAHSQASRLAVAATSSNSSLIPNSKILLGGIGQERTITLSPAANASGTATIKVTVGDGDLITTNTFVIQVAPVNDLPTITRIPDQSILGEGSTPPIPFIIGDLESSAASLIVSAISSNPQLVPNSGIVFGGSGSNRTVRITPKSSSSGGTTITVKVSDGRDSVATAFLVEVLEPGAIPLSGLALWLRADALQLLDGGEVAQWNDQSGNNRHATQTFAPGRPTMVNNAVNGKPAVRLDGIDDYLTFNLPVNGLTGLSVFLVAANTEIQSGGASGAERAALFWNENASWGTIYLSPYQSSVQLRFGTTQSENRVSYSRPNSVGSSFTLTSAIKNGGTDSLYVNGNLAVSSNGKFNTIAGCQSTGNIGRGYNDNTYFAGYVAELLVYTRALSPVEREAVETQLNDKYLLIGPRPRLDLARTGNLLRLSWPSDAPDYVLEIKEGFLSEWREADEVPVVENGENVVMTNVAQPIRFYRLRRR